MGGGHVAFSLLFVGLVFSTILMESYLESVTESEPSVALSFAAHEQLAEPIGMDLPAE